MSDWVRAATKWHVVKSDVSPGIITTLCGLTLEKVGDEPATDRSPRCRKCRSLRGAVT